MKSALGILLWLAGLDEVKVGAPDVRIVGKLPNPA
jgi:hypothetical protein